MIQAVPASPAGLREAGFPWMTVLLCLACLLCSLLYALLEPQQQRVVVEAVGANPARLSELLSGNAHSGWGVLFLSLFFHSSWLHLVGNLVYLWVFGLPVEGRTGPLGLAGVFFGGGALAHLMLGMQLPGFDGFVIGASGAVSAVVGACAGLYPTRRIGLFLPLGLVVESVQLPTLLVVGSWFLLQLLYALVGPTFGAMAWWTHLAGFALGLVFALLARAIAVATSGRRRSSGSKG
jgi:membrane associated rhomboid family serine protease